MMIGCVRQALLKMCWIAWASTTLMASMVGQTLTAIVATYIVALFYPDEVYKECDEHNGALEGKQSHVPTHKATSCEKAKSKVRRCAAMLRDEFKWNQNHQLHDKQHKTRVVTIRQSSRKKLLAMMTSLANQATSTTAPIHQNKVTFDTDSFEIGIDDRASGCMSHVPEDFEGPLIPCDKSIKGIWRHKDIRSLDGNTGVEMVR